MADWRPHAQREAALAGIEARLSAGEGGAKLLLARADLLVGLGRAEAAQSAYMDLLRAAPGHRVGLNNFAALVRGQGFIAAARTLHAEAARLYPDDPMSQVNHGGDLIELGEVEAAERAFTAALTAEPGFPPACLGLARLAAERGEAVLAERRLSEAFAKSAVIEEPYRGAGPPIKVLLLISGLPADIPLRHVLDPAMFQVTALAPAYFDTATPPPPHDLVFNGIGDADVCDAALQAATRLIEHWRAKGAARPVINPPDRVAPTGRVANAQRLGELEDVVAAQSVELPHAAALRVSAADLDRLGLRFPIAARAPGFHTGRHFERIDGFVDLAPTVAALPGDAVILMNLIDSRGSDGLFRKYRAMMIDGVLHPLHLAVSPLWKVHYFTADMAERPDHRALDAAFLADMPAVLGARAMAALERVKAALGLDYGGIDFTLTPAGEVLVFEANAAMVVYPPPPGEIWDYRRAPTERVIDAVRAMIKARAAPKC
jgi:hypothetical protein